MIHTNPATGGSNQTATVQPIGNAKDTKSSTGQDGTVDAAEDTATISSVASWGLDRIDQTSLPLNGYYSPGDYDGRGVHSKYCRLCSLGCTSLSSSSLLMLQKPSIASIVAADASWHPCQLQLTVVPHVPIHRHVLIL